jgi:hypothetical protein
MRKLSSSYRHSVGLFTLCYMELAKQNWIKKTAGRKAGLPQRCVRADNCVEQQPLVGSQHDETMTFQIMLWYLGNENGQDFFRRFAIST